MTLFTEAMLSPEEKYCCYYYSKLTTRFN